VQSSIVEVMKLFGKNTFVANRRENDPLCSGFAQSKGNECVDTASTLSLQELHTARAGP
jgi:hypothetical protein